MQKRLLCTALSLGMILGVLSGCGDTTKETVPDESTQPAVEESAEADLREELKEELREELKEELKQELAEDIADEPADIEIIEENTEESIVDSLFNYSYKDFESLDYNELALDLEDMDIDYEINTSSDTSEPDKISYSTYINNIDFWEFNSYVGINDHTKSDGVSRSRPIRLEITSDLGKGHDSLDNKEKIIKKLQECMYDKNSEYIVPLTDLTESSTYSANSREELDNIVPLDSYPVSFDITTDVYLYLLDVYDLPNESDGLKLYKVCIADFRHVPEGKYHSFGEDLSVLITVDWLIQYRGEPKEISGIIGFYDDTPRPMEAAPAAEE